MKPAVILSTASLTALMISSSAFADAPIIDIAPVMECRALAISHQQVADFEVARFSEASTLALREQADLALILGVWGAPLSSVEKATRDMNIGERMLIDHTRQVIRLSSAETGPQGYSAQMEGCVPVIWTAVKAVVDAMIQNGADRARLPKQPQ